MSITTMDTDTTMDMGTDTRPAARASTDDFVHVLAQTDHLRSLHTVIRDKDCPREDFVRTSGRIIRLLIETALGLFSFQDQGITTGSGNPYAGRRPSRPVQGVSVARGGDSMEAEFRTMVPGARLGKILIQRDKVTKLPHLYFSALPPGIADADVLLFDPMLATGGTALAAIDVLREAGVEPEHLVFVNLLSSPQGIAAVRERFPGLPIVTSSIEQRLNEQAFMVPGIGDFGDRYFGTDVHR
jgi:uracil phosphoribosyltransferase